MKHLAIDRYTNDWVLYHEFAKLIESKARRACRAAGVVCGTQARAKTVASFAKKLLRDKLTYENVHDKAGVRLLPLYPDDRAQLADIVRRTFVVTWSKDFVAEAKPDQFSYRGFHFSVALNEDDRKEAKSEIAGLVAELQIHTPGESVWASVNHDLIYKAPVEIPANLRRSLNRISALLELVDTEMSNTRKQILGLEGSSVARVLAALEKHFFLLRGEPYDTRLSRIVLEALAPLVDSDTFEANIDQFVKMNGGKLDHVFREYEGAEHVMLTQPESLLIFYLSSSHTPELQTCWPGTLPQAILEDLFSIWVPQATTN